MKTADLTGPALDWAVAEVSGTPIYRSGKTLTRMDMDGQHYWQPSIDWSQGGPIIERMAGLIIRHEQDKTLPELAWVATLPWPNRFNFGPTPLIAAMRCFVASRLGGEVDIPEELR